MTLSDSLYRLNDALADWAADEGLEPTDEQLDEAVHEAVRILHGRPAPPPKRPSFLQRWLHNN